MAYLGNAPARSFISFERQVFTIVNSQTAYTLDHSVNNENDLRLVINNIVQEPGSGKAYTASGTTLTLSAALTNGTDEMYCVFLGRAVATNAPGAGSVNTAAIAADAVTEAKIADDAVESEHLNDNVISGQTELATAPASTDELLINRTSGDTGVYKISRTNLFKAIPTLPVGMITPYGGITEPTNWLFCYGQEVNIADYQNLFNVIGYQFKDQSLVSAGKFAIPDFRGRMPLGKDNMGGGSANVVTDSSADTVGSVNGQQTQTLSTSNLPEHEHDLRGPSGDQYYTIRDISGTPNDSQGITYDAPTGTGAGQAYPTSGGVLTNSSLGNSFNIMNPYMTVNYIIYAGENTFLAS